MARAHDILRSGWHWRDSPHGPASGRAMAAPAFTLIEMLIVVAVIAVVAGAALMLSTGAVERTDQQMISAECAAIRDAVLRFRADMGGSPRLLAELLQPPDPSDARGGWWWRTDGTPSAALYAYDPATRRGWSGPYLHADALSDPDAETVELRLVGHSVCERTTASPGAGRGLAVLLSRFSTCPQQSDDDARAVSHYQLDASDADQLFVRFVRDPLAPAGAEDVVARLALGVQP